jgi:protease-4
MGMMARVFIFISLVFIPFSASALHHACDNPFVVPERGSASYSSGPFGQTINPVFADLQSTPLLAYQYMFYDGRKSGSHFAQAGLFGFTFLYAWFQDICRDREDRLDHAGASYFKFTKGIFIKNIFGLGASYSFSRSDNRLYKGYRGLDVSMLVTPWRYISVGFVLKDAWAEINGNRLKWREVYSLSIRPYTERVTLSLDVIRKRGEKASRLDYRGTVDVMLWYDISLFASLDKHLNLFFGIAFPLQFHAFPVTGIDFHYYRAGNIQSAHYQNVFGLSVPVFKDKSALSIPGGSNYLMVTIDGSIDEIDKRSFFGCEPVVFYDILRCVSSAASDPGIDGIILKINKAGIGFAQVQELRRELKKARSAGKKVYTIMRTPGNKEYYLASAADKIYFTPDSTFYFTGLMAQVYFFKGLMEKIGVQLESVKHGAYKSFNESFTRKHMSDASRKNVTSVLKDLNGQYINDIMADRRITRSDIDALFSKGQLLPEDAVKDRFVDMIGYPDEAMDDISSRGVTLISVSSYMKERVKDFSWGLVPRIAIVYIDGSIVSGTSFKTGLFRSIGDAKYARMLERAFSDPSIAALVIRVNSGGGSALASDYMWNSLVKMKKKYSKPVVFSLGKLAASGGYYVACTGDTIFSDRGTITGSIGVVYGKITLQDLYRKLGINKDVVKMSQFADIFSESRTLTKQEKKLLQEAVDFSYNRFTGRVVEGRKIKAADISSLAEGRVFTGLQALDRRLVDEIGSLVTAVEYAKKLARVQRNIEIAKFPDDRGPLLDLFNIPLIKLLSDLIGSMLGSVQPALLQDEGALYLFPYQIEIQ